MVNIFMKRRYRGVGRKKKTSIYKQFQDCCYCGKSLTIETATVEHIIKYEFCQHDRLDNLDISCSQCNRQYANMDHKWKAFRFNLDKNEIKAKKHLKSLYNIMSDYLNKRRRVRNPILDVYPVVQFLISGLVLQQ